MKIALLDSKMVWLLALLCSTSNSLDSSFLLLLLVQIQMRSSLRIDCSRRRQASQSKVIVVLGKSWIELYYHPQLFGPLFSELPSRFNLSSVIIWLIESDFFHDAPEVSRHHHLYFT